jgi:hypothetical protein
MKNLAHLSDYPRSDYLGTWEIQLLRRKEHQIANDPTSPIGYRAYWTARVFSYDPIGWQYGEVFSRTYLAHWPRPIYPELIHGDADTPPQRRAREVEWREQCSRIYQAHPQALHDVATRQGSTGWHAERDDAEQEARLASQQFVLSIMPSLRRHTPLTEI